MPLILNHLAQLFMETQRIQNNLNTYLARTVGRKLEQLSSVNSETPAKMMSQVSEEWQTSAAAEDLGTGPQDQHCLHNNTTVLYTFSVFDICCALCNGG